MRTTTRLLFALFAVATMAVAACGSDTATTTTAAAQTTTSGAPTTTGAATTTKAATTTTAAATTTTVDPAKLKSSDPIAAALDKSILTTEELGSAGTSKFVEYKGDAANPPPAQGPLSLDGVVSIFPSPIYKDPLTAGKASVGANRTYQIDLDGKPGPLVNILAIKFESAATAATFVQTATNIAIQIGGAKQNPHPEVEIGVTPGTVLIVPPGPQDDPPLETVVTASLYENGVYYLISIVTSPGSIPDQAVLDILMGQDIKYKAAKDALGL